MAITGLLSSGCILVVGDGDTDTAGTATQTGSETGATGSETGGDGDGDSTTGDGDGDGTALCGWGPTGDPVVPEGYVCGGMGEDPTGTWSMACPDGLVAGDACGNLTGVGCCDADGNAWFCGNDGTMDLLAMEDCSGDGDGDGDGDGTTGDGDGDGTT